MNSKLTNQLFELMNEQTKELREDKERLYKELSTRGSGAKGKVEIEAKKHYLRKNLGN